MYMFKWRVDISIGICIHWIICAQIIRNMLYNDDCIMRVNEGRDLMLKQVLLVLL
jgi:hypothetical protein